MTDGRGTARRLLASRRVRLIVPVGIATGGAWALAARGELDALLGRIAGADAALIAAAVVVYAASWPLRGDRYRRVLDGMDHPIGLGSATGAVFLSQTANLVAPLRAGDASRAYVVHEESGVPYRAGAASLVVERALDLGAVAILGGLAALPLAGAVAGVDGRARSVLLAAGAAGLVTAIGLVALDRGVGRGVVLWSRGGRLAPVGRVVEEVLDGFGATGRDRGVWLESLGIWGVDAATALVVAAALGVAVAPAVAAALVLAVCAGNLAKVVPATPGGVGLYEAGFAAVAASLAPIGVPAAVAVAVVDHGVKNVVTVAGGLAAAVAMEASMTGEEATDDGSGRTAD